MILKKNTFQGWNRTTRVENNSIKSIFICGVSSVSFLTVGFSFFLPFEEMEMLLEELLEADLHLVHTW
jgi:hypothetical protein